MNTRIFSLSTENSSLKKQLEATQKENKALQQRINNPTEAYLREKLAEIEKQKQVEAKRDKERAYIIDLQKDKIEMQNKLIEDLELNLQKWTKI